MSADERRQSTLIERSATFPGLILMATLTVGLAGCVPFALSTKVGYASTEVGGRLALATGTPGQPAIEQSIESAFGLGDSSGSPYLRAETDLGPTILTASVLWLRDSGEGQLDDSFGGLPASTPVAGSLDLLVAKVTGVYEFDLGIVSLAPGVLFDVFAIDFTARELTLGSSEEIDDVVFVPMPFLRVEADLGPITAIAEGGFLEVASLGDSSGRFMDFEGLVEWSPGQRTQIFLGYRFIDIDGNGDTGSETFAADLQIRGWVVGGGVRF